MREPGSSRRSRIAQVVHPVEEVQALLSFVWKSSERRVDDEPGAPEVDERDEGLRSVEAEGAVGEQPDFGVECFDAAVGEPEPDRGEDPVPVAADRAGELDERLELAA